MNSLKKTILMFVVMATAAHNMLAQKKSGNCKDDR